MDKLEGIWKWIEEDDQENIERYFGGYSGLFDFLLRKRLTSKLDEYFNENSNYYGKYLIWLYNIDLDSFNERILNIFDDVVLENGKFYMYVYDTEDLEKLFCDHYRKGFIEELINGDYYDYNSWSPESYEVIDALNSKSIESLKKIIIKELEGVKVESDTNLLETIANFQNHPEYVDVNQTNIEKIINDRSSIKFILENYLEDLSSELTRVYLDAYSRATEDVYHKEVWSELGEYFDSHEYDVEIPHKYNQNKKITVIKLGIINFYGNVLDYLERYYDNVEYYGSYITLLKEDKNCLRLNDNPYIDVDDHIDAIFEDQIGYSLNKKINELRELPPKRTPKKIASILDQIKLFEVYPKIFALVIKDDYLRSRVFLRYQEFYESDSENFRGKGFTWEQFVNYYKEKTKSEIFTYHEDWAGYNIPCNSIESCMAEVPDLNVYDLIMFSVIGTIREIVGSSNYYLIGVDHVDSSDKELIYHEIAHGLWFSDPSYKKKMKSLIKKIDPKTLEDLKYTLGDMGYGENVFDDEVQAYLSTGLSREMIYVDLNDIVEKFEKVFNSYITRISNKQIPIDWSLHF